MPDMTSRERFYSLLQGKTADRPALVSPVSVATRDSLRALGISLAGAHADAGALCALAAYSHEHLGFDSVMPYVSVVAEGAALGAPIDWGDDTTMPSQRGTVFSGPGDVRAPEGYLDRPTTRAIIDAVRLLKARCPDAVVIGKALGPWTMCLHMHGMENTLVGTLDDPQLVLDMTRALLPLVRMFVAAQLEAGADMVTIADHFTRNLIGPDGYADFLLPLHKELCAEFPGRLILHCCGNTEDRVAEFAKAGFALYHFESANRVPEMLRLAGDMPLTGCVNNPDVLLLGTPADVRAQCERIVRDGITLVSPECAVPLQVSNENLLAIGQALREIALS